MSNLNLVASELKQAGFGVIQTNDLVSVYLKSRKPSIMEVEHVLEQAFEGIQFNFQSTANSVIVRL